MAFLNNFQKTLGVRISKRFGRSDHPDPRDVKGIYQMRRTKRGIVPIRMKFYRPYNPRTIPQQANRTKFAGAMAAWQALSEDEKSDYNRKAKYRHMTGHNLFIRWYLNTN